VRRYLLAAHEWHFPLPLPSCAAGRGEGPHHKPTPDTISPYLPSIALELGWVPSIDLPGVLRGGGRWGMTLRQPLEEKGWTDSCVPLPAPRSPNIAIIFSYRYFLKVLSVYCT